jgi:hypothetical protein
LPTNRPLRLICVGQELKSFEGPTGGKSAMKAILWITFALMSVLPCFIAYKRNCKNFILIDLLSFFLSWTIVGWIAAMAWAILGKSDPEEFRKQTGAV